MVFYEIQESLSGKQYRLPEMRLPCFKGTLFWLNGEQKEAHQFLRVPYFETTLDAFWTWSMGIWLSSSRVLFPESSNEPQIDPRQGICAKEKLFARSLFGSWQLGFRAQVCGSCNHFPARPTSLRLGKINPLENCAFHFPFSAVGVEHVGFSGPLSVIPREFPSPFVY